MTEPEYESVRILRLQPGDTIVVRLADNYPPGVVQSIKDQLEPKFPDHEVLVLGPNVDLELVCAEDLNDHVWTADDEEDEDA
jgi:hypothetical protein